MLTRARNAARSFLNRAMNRAGRRYAQRTGVGSRRSSGGSGSSGH